MPETTRKVTLRETWVYAGKTYGPGGAVEVSPEVYDALEAKGAFEPRPATTTDTAPDATSTSDTPTAPDTASASDARLRTLPDEIRDKLIASGYDDDETVRRASNEDLRAVDGIGPKSLERIRAAYQDEG